jgi:nitroimidazol reductase NimA-like FMN-containing flavoprotein (pyridoxamine 5'-phosphate oxidase superfamily)
MSDTWLEKLSDEECLAHLRSEVVGRIAVIAYGLPVVFPINYRTIGGDHDAWLVVRTRPGNVIDRGSRHVAFEIDGIDHSRRQGWSVLVRGTLLHLTAEQVARLELPDTDSWLSEERDAWLALQPSAITGRRLQTLTPDWAFQARGSL